jgi:Domain of unknown function (DUF5063)
MSDEELSELQMQAQRFVSVAEKYLNWVNTPARPADEEVLITIALLLELYYEVMLLPEALPINEVTGVRPDESYQEYFEFRFQMFPFRYFGYVFDPLKNPPEPPVVGDIGEDLTSIYLELYEGLSLYHGGYIAEAVWTWKTSFRNLWGRQLIAALSAVQQYESVSFEAQDQQS